MSEYDTLADVPDRWIPLRDWGEDSNIEGATFIDTTGSGFKLIRYHSNAANKTLRFYDTEAKDLINRLAEYQHDAFRRRRQP
jgi:hypothetical protein